MDSDNPLEEEILDLPEVEEEELSTELKVWLKIIGAVGVLISFRLLYVSFVNWRALELNIQLPYLTELFLGLFLLVGSALLYRKKRLGWFFTSLFCAFFVSLLTSLFVYSRLSSDSTIEIQTGEVFLTILIITLPLGIFLFLQKKSIRSYFNISKSNQLAVIVIGVCASLAYLFMINLNL